MHRITFVAPTGATRWIHIAVLTFLLVGHTLVHYTILLPTVGEAVEHLPFFNLHVLHEAEYLVAVAYASIVFRFTGGLIAMLAMVVASIPFALAQYIDPLEYVEYGFGGVGDNVIEVVVLLAIGAFIVFVNEMWGRERDQAAAIAERLETANRQLTGLNQTVQGQITALFGTLREMAEEERVRLSALPPGSARDQLAAFVHRVAEVSGAR